MSAQPRFILRSFQRASSTLMILTDFSARISPTSTALFPRQPQPKQAAASLHPLFCSKSLSSGRMIKLFTDSEFALLRTLGTMMHTAQRARVALRTILGGTDFSIACYNSGQKYFHLAFFPFFARTRSNAGLSHASVCSVGSAYNYHHVSQSACGSTET